MLKNQIVSWISKKLFDNVSYSVRNGLNKGLRRRGGSGWLSFKSNDTHELRFWRNPDLDGKFVYDIGAFHGLLTIFLVRRAKAVVAREPNSMNRRRLKENLQLKGFGKVVFLPNALSSEPTQATMSPGLNGLLNLSCPSPN
jgi:hypothetical protein